LAAPTAAMCDHRITIPMAAGADSLNVATAGALMLFARAGHLRK
jgi:tRNA G18 (ribose-2'-O)-methylase SpoU